MGRPVKDPLDRRTAKLPPVRLKDAELAALTSQAAAHGLSLTEYVRQRALGGRMTAPRATADDRLLSEVNRIGVNLNQIARSLNAGQGYDPHHLNHVLARLMAAIDTIVRPP